MGTSINCPSSEKATISSYLDCKNSSLYPRIAPLRKIFSCPVRSISKPEPSSSMGTMLPRLVTVPSVGFKMPEITFKMVLLPAPLWPMMPMTSPLYTSKLACFSAQNSLVFSLPLSLRVTNSFRDMILSSVRRKRMDTSRTSITFFRWRSASRVCRSRSSFFVSFLMLATHYR